MPSCLPKVPSWLRKNALCLSQSALSNFALYVISFETSHQAPIFRPRAISTKACLPARLLLARPLTLRRLFRWWLRKKRAKKKKNSRAPNNFWEVKPGDSYAASFPWFFISRKMKDPRIRWNWKHIKKRLEKFFFLHYRKFLVGILLSDMCVHWEGPM